MSIHIADLFWAEGPLGQFNCEWRHVQSKRFDLTNRVKSLAGYPQNTYRVLAERED